MTQVNNHKAATAGRTPGNFDPVLIRASAGTGKTFVLSHRFIALLAAGESPRRILATTFTRKAAGEIQARVLQRLAGAAMGDPRVLKELADNGTGQIDRAKAGELLRRIARELSLLNICTLDSFFMRVARGFGLELGL